jgi:hypothetical protein
MTNSVSIYTLIVGLIYEFAQAARANNSAPCNPRPTRWSRSSSLYRELLPVHELTGSHCGPEVRFWEVKSISYSSESDSGPMAIDSQVTIPSKSSSPYGSANT